MMKRRIICLVAMVVACVSTAHAEVVIETVTVGNPGNAGKWAGSNYGGCGTDRKCGAVDYVYKIAKFEVTAGQYTEFLNAVAAADPYRLYRTSMADIAFFSSGCNIRRYGLPGSYRYSVEPDWASRPVNYVSWGDAARFCNWLRNGQPTGAQNLTTTENGSYFLNGAMSREELMAVVRGPDATWVIPTEDEFHKAAYHKNDGVTGNYFDYPTSSNIAPGNRLYEPDQGNSANFYYSGDFAIGPPYYRSIVGAFENSQSPYGTFDQGGNIDEWCETAFGGWADARVLRGGSYADTSPWHLHAACRGAGTPEAEDYYVGFRVARVNDCNDNGILDRCDLDCGFAGGNCDIDGCGESDDCQPNGVPDECDIEDGTSADTNEDGIPDECPMIGNLDIKPGSCPNPVNPRSRGVVPVAVVGDESFDVSQIDVDTLTLGRTDGLGGSVSPLSGPPGPGMAIDDVATPFTGELCDCHELEGDGIDDLVLKFSTPEFLVAFQLDESAKRSWTQLILSGSLLDGTAFEASDCIILVGKPDRNDVARPKSRGSRDRG